MNEASTTRDEAVALAKADGGDSAAIRNAVTVWSDATTTNSSPRWRDIQRDKLSPVASLRAVIERLSATVVRSCARRGN